MKKKSKQSRTRFVAYVASSIDGRISLNQKNLPDWTSKEDWKFFQTSLAKHDAVVVGHTTYRVSSTRLRKRNTFVLSSRVGGIVQKDGVTFVNPAKVDLATVFGGYTSVAILGGAEVYQTMLNEKLLHEIYVTVEPLIFGRGREMFVGGTKTTRLKLVSVRKLNPAGTLLLHYCLK